MKQRWKVIFGIALPAILAVIFCAAALAAGAEEASYAEATAWLQNEGLMQGVSATDFDPEGTLTRAMVAAVLYRAAGEPAVSGSASFADVRPDQWYSDAVLWAHRQGIVQGYGNDLFRPEAPITREQLDVILRRYQGESPQWTGDPALAATVTRAEAAMAFYAELRKDKPEAKEKKVLTAYFSRYGNTDYENDVDASSSASVVIKDGERQGTTELVARMIAEQTGGDLFLIETQETYPANFDRLVEQNHQELAAGTRPALSAAVDFSEYDVIFVGYPVWASNAPAPVLSFLESGDLSGKRVIPFCTHDGYGAGSSYTAIARSAAGAAVEKGLSLEASAGLTETAVSGWLQELGFSAKTSETGKGEAKLHITAGEIELEGILYDSEAARQLAEQLPQTISMSNYGGREVYGRLEKRIAVEGGGQLSFEDGDITYCPANNTLAVFYAQSSQPNLTMEVYPVGKVTSDLSIFHSLPSGTEIAFEITT